jgi:formate-dependent phosphoribosylglycinamide formyltransferase (GAR transformylase)
MNPNESHEALWFADVSTTSYDTKHFAMSIQDLSVFFLVLRPDITNNTIASLQKHLVGDGT